MVRIENEGYSIETIEGNIQGQQTREKATKKWKCEAEENRGI